MKIIITGATGRMGQALLLETLRHPACQLVGAIVRPNHPLENQDISTLIGLPHPTQVSITSDLERLLPEADAIIDFSSPEYSLYTAELAAKHHSIHVIGTTGFSSEEMQSLTYFSQHTPIIWSANMSIGVNLLIGLVKQTAACLPAESTDIEIVEMHHKHKKDAPSGTALLLGEAAASGREIALKTHAIMSREGFTGERPEGAIGFATLRGGDVIGDHTVIFASEGERIEISHKASQRTIFAKGALRAAVWAKHQPPGFYSMQHVLGFAA